jgi:uncharacterized protein YhbP (UPF0306 family)
MNMPDINASIAAFLEGQKCANICCVDPLGNPYCFSGFYTVNVKAGLLYFKSSADTRHISMIKENPRVAGTILPDKLQLLVVKGIQFEGKVLLQDMENSKQGYRNYHIKFPYALAIPGEVWTIQLTSIKMTDSTKGMGNKTTWKRSEPMLA